MKELKQTDIFGKVTINEFLQDYWHKKPLLIKGFHPTPEKLASIKDLLEMAQDENFESRIVYPPSGDQNWVAKEGPITTQDLARDEFTIAVHGLDLYFEEFTKVRNLFNFIPDWQFDDIMATYSKPGIGVGAHIDNYDVFIFQGQGKRKWSLDTNPNPNFIEGIDIKILEVFNPDIEWILEPGDMVYLPPKIAHHGETLEESISYSIGFKAEDSEKVLQDFAMSFLSSYSSNTFIDQPAMKNMNSPFEMTSKHFDIMKKQMMERFFEDDHFSSWAQAYLSRPRNPIAEGEDLDLQTIANYLKDGETLHKDVSVKFNYRLDHTDQKQVILYVSTLKFTMKQEVFNQISPLLQTPSYQEVDLDSVLNSEEAMKIVKECLKFGIFYFN